jgi:hypothetical protein
MSETHHAECFKAGQPLRGYESCCQPTTAPTPRETGAEACPRCGATDTWYPGDGETTLRVPAMKCRACRYEWPAFTTPRPDAASASVAEARKRLNACVDALCLMQSRWTHDRTTAQWQEQVRATAEYQQALNALESAALAAAPRDAGREEDARDAERYRALRDRMRLLCDDEVDVLYLYVSVADLAQGRFFEGVFTRKAHPFFSEKQVRAANKDMSRREWTDAETLDGAVDHAIKHTDALRAARRGATG